MPRIKKTADAASTKKNASLAKKPVLSASTASAEQRADSATSTVEEKIRQRAYELFLERNGHAGSAEQDWLQAEAEVRSRRSA